MTLKGYQWLNDDGSKVIMSFYFKRLDLILWEDVTQDELNKFINYLKENGHDTYYINYNNHIVK